MKHVSLVLPAVLLLACSLFSASVPRDPLTLPASAQKPAPPALNTIGAPSFEFLQAASPPDAAVFPDASAFEWKKTASGLDRPVDIQSAHDGSGRLFIVEKPGRIRIYQNGGMLPTPFLDLTNIVNDGDIEMGLLGLAFHPDYKNNGFFYVNYTGGGGTTHIARFQVTADPNIASPASQKTLLALPQPFSNHNGGALVFGPDGYLYAGLGDGGGAGDPAKNGQNTTSLLGKILRIDVDIADPYGIPAGNPFGNEVWAYGLRNPWRMSFDSLTGDLWIGDVGQGAWEEIDFLPAGSPGGANFGWSLVEGNHNYDGVVRPGLTLPVAEYGHALGCSVIGGYVYRGIMLEWKGIYFFGDYCSGTIWGLLISEGGMPKRILFETGLNLTSFGQDDFGEVYFASDNGGVHLLKRKGSD